MKPGRYCILCSSSKKKNARRNGYDTVYVKNVTDVFQKQVPFCRRQDSIFCPEQGDKLGNVAFQIMATDYS